MDDPWLSDKAIQRSIICRGVVTEYGCKWNLREAAAYVTFHEGAVPKPLFFTGSVWPPTSCCPPIGSDELLVSNVVELSHDGPPDIEFSGGSITVSLMHSASDLKGYEVVIKQLMDPNGDEWKDLETRYLMDMPEAGKPEISDWPQFVEASCLFAQCSTFAAIWRLKTFSFSRHTSVAHQLTCVVPDFPDVRVEVPLTSLPVDQDFTFTLKVQEFPSSEVEEGILVGPVLHISSSHSIEHFEPVTIKIPLTLRESKHDFSKFSNEVVRLLYLDPEEKPKSWTDITDELEGQVFLKDGIVEFKVKHFSRFWLVCKLKNLVSQLEDFTRRSFPTPMPQRVHFLACLRETLCHAKYELLLYCFLNIRRADVVQEISRYETPFIGEGKSKEPLCKGDKIVVSLSALTFEHESQKNKEIVLEFLGNDISDNSHMALIVNLVRDSVPVVKFRTCEEIPKVVCEVTFSKPRSTSAVSSPMGVAMVEERPHFSGYDQEHTDFYASQQPSTSASGRPQIKQGTPTSSELQLLGSDLGRDVWLTLGGCLGIKEPKLDEIDE
ncbi:uncharacterized protein LOC111346126 isoform X2 [Stylophora pistillata]|uniref:uncharacterized protein LOC111346126 isoform X2 n=1 Tax=Stylophora pistillata TaxID=50429 RepID=UPI000C043A26|nr:uncharacterized protein LOC111346126 isoform X2 [Stylophora pistillata]